MSDHKWEVGQDVAVHEGGWPSRLKKAKIEKVGKIHVTVRGVKYRLSGWSVGDHYNRTIITPWDETKHQLILIQQHAESLLSRIDGLSRKVTTANAERVIPHAKALLAILEPTEEEAAK